MTRSLKHQGKVKRRLHHPVIVLFTFFVFSYANELLGNPKEKESLW
jgi:hypothetical protein